MREVTVNEELSTQYDNKTRAKLEERANKIEVNIGFYADGLNEPLPFFNFSEKLFITRDGLFALMSAAVSAMYEYEDELNIELLEDIMKQVMVAMVLKDEIFFEEDIQENILHDFEDDVVYYDPEDVSFRGLVWPEMDEVD